LGLDTYNELLSNYKYEYYLEAINNRGGRAAKATQALECLNAIGISEKIKESNIYDPPINPINLTALACLDLFVFGGDLDTPASRDGVLEIYTKYSVDVQRTLLSLGLRESLVCFPPYRDFYWKHGSSMEDGAWLDPYRGSNWVEISSKCFIAKESCYLSEQETMYAISWNVTDHKIYTIDSNIPANKYSYNCFHNHNDWSQFYSVIDRVESYDDLTVKQDNFEGGVSIKGNLANVDIGIVSFQLAQRNNFSNPPEMLKRVLELGWLKIPNLK